MGLVDYIEDDNKFLMVSFFAQALGGLGAGANLTASMAILSSFAGDEREVGAGGSAKGSHTVPKHGRR